MLRIGIISYLPNDEKVRQDRIKAHHKQLALMYKLNCPIYILSQSYQDSDFVENDVIHYIKHEKGIGPANARNELLRQFYNSEDDWMLLCDDDRYFYDYYDIFTFFNEIINNSKKFIDLDYIRTHSANKLPFKKLIYENPLNLTNYVFEDTQTIGDTGIALVRNFKKYYSKELYYNDLKAENGEGYEDKDFCCILKLNGIKTHILTTFISSSYNYTESSTIFKSYDYRMSVHSSNNELVVERYKNTDLFVNGKLNKKYKDNPILVPRKCPMVIPDNLKPKYESGNTNAKKLF